MKKLTITVSLILLLTAPNLAKAAVEEIDFATQIKPLLAAKCFDCHAADTQESHLRLDRRAAMLRGGDSGEPAIVVGNSEGSHLIKLVRGEEAGKLMPPDEANRLSRDEIELLRTWIDQGVVWPGPDGADEELAEKIDHWSFQPVRRTPPPAMNDPWIANGIDAFILQKQTAHSLSPNPQAARAELIRRMSLDMLGLPPTPEDVQAFVADRDPQAVQKLVERMLSSPHYG